MNKTPRIDFWWSLLFGTALGVETMLSALVLFGPARVKPEVAEQLTDRGRALFRPEHDVAIYAAGCVLTALLVPGFSWLWRRRLARLPDAARDECIRRGCGQLSVAAALFFAHLGLLLAIKSWFRFEIHTLPAFPICVLAAPVLASLLIATIGSSWNIGVAPPGLVRLFAAPAALHEFPNACFNRWWDILMPLLLCAVIYIPGWRNLAGQCFMADRFHHWDHFAMGPTLAFHHGKALGTDAYTQYGVGWPMLFSALSGLIPLTYGRLIQVGVIYGCVYFIGAYVFLRLVLGSAVWAAAGVVLALALQTFHGLDATTSLWFWPTSTVLRSTMDIWLFIALLCHLRSRRTTWAVVAGALVGLAILFETDTGIYLALVFAAYWIFSLGLAGKAKLSIARRLSPAVSSVGVTALVLLAGLAVASRGTLLRPGFWAGWLESLFTYSGGISMLPIATVPNESLVLFMVMVTVLLGGMGMALIKLPRRESTVSDVLLGCLASYGLLVLILFVGRSHPFNLFHPSVPFSLLMAVLAARLHERFECFSAGQPHGSGRATWKLAATLAPWCVLGWLGFWLLWNPAFRNYPGALHGLISTPPAEGLCLLSDPPDVGGLPAEAGDFVRLFRSSVSSLRPRVAAGQLVAVLDEADTIFYLAAGAAPWGRYAPCFAAIMRRSQLAALQGAIVSRGPQWVMIQSNGLQAQSAGDEDIWRALHQTVESCYRLEDTSGMFEMWRRIER